jgi:DNA polymerase II large subunit
MLKLFDNEYGKEAQLTVTRGNVHDYLGITIVTAKEGKCKSQ